MKNMTYILLAMLWLPGMLYAQETALKTNALYWATITPNLSVEYALNSHLSVDLQVSYNNWRLGSEKTNRKMKHWLIKPELRFWIYEKFDGHFLGVHPFYMQYNVGNIHLPLRIWQELKDYRYEGYGVGLGFSYGYQWYLHPHWNLEAEFGFGYAYLNHDKYQYQKCGECLGSEHKHYFGPTKIAVSLVYLFKSTK